MTADPRRLAIDALVRIDEGGAYANLVLGQVLDRSGLDARDRGFATELVYGVTRRRRALDHMVDRYLLRPVDPAVRAALRVGAYQLHVLGTPAHAAVSATVSAVADRRARGLVNAVLRRVAVAPVDDDAWPDVGTRLSYPDWIVERLVADLGEADAVAALEAMDDPAVVTARPDGYVQDLASQWVAELVDAGPGDVVADVCAAPGGKATALAEGGARVVAGDIRPARARLVAANAVTLGLSDRLLPVVADAAAFPLPAMSCARVLLDAPCSGLGTLRRRPDARWRVDPAAVERLFALQCRLALAAVDLVAPGGTFVYSVCTLTVRETIGVDEHVAAARPDLVPLPPPGPPWQPWGRGALLLPHFAGTDGMAIFRLAVPA